MAASDYHRMLIFRAMASQDAAECARLSSASALADGGGRALTPERAAALLATPGLDLASASLAAFDGAAMLGFVIAEAQAEVVGGEHRASVYGDVHPGHRRRGLGTRLLREGVGFARLVHQRHHPDLDLAIDVRCPEDSPGHSALYEREGFRRIRRYQEMARPLSGEFPPATAPAGMAVEAWSEETDPEFMAVRNAAFQDHWGSALHTPESWRARARSAGFYPELTFLARDAATGRPAGIALSHRWPDEGGPEGLDAVRIQVIATVREFRKRGVAAGLIARVLAEAADRGHRRISLYVDASNPTGAVAVYERAGFETVRATALWTLDG